MKKVTIFLAYHKDELASDTNRIVNFVYKLNEVYENRDVEFATVDCNEVDQNQLVAQLEQCEIAFVLVSQHVDRRIFDVTFDVFKRLGTPKITTFFKYQHDVNEATGEVKDFLDFLDTQLHHYYKVYNHIDSLKLHILMQVKRLGLDFVSPQLQGKDICVDGQSIANTSNLGVFAKNASLADVEQQLAQANSQINGIIAELQTAPDSQRDALVQQLAGLSQNKSQLAEKHGEMQKQVLETLLDLYNTTADDGASQRQIVASRYMDAGQWDKAKQVLNKDAILLDLKTNCQNADMLKQATEQANKKVQQNVEELLQRIVVLKQEGLTEASVAEVSELYQIAFAHASERKLGLDGFVEYVEFLTTQNRAQEALSVGNAVEQSWKNGCKLPHIKQMSFYMLMQRSAIALYNSELVERYTNLMEQHFRDAGNYYNGTNYVLFLMALLQRSQYIATANPNQQLQLEILNKGLEHAKTLARIAPDTGGQFVQIFQTQLMLCSMNSLDEDVIRQVIATMETSIKASTEELLQATPSLRVDYTMACGILAIMHAAIDEMEQSDCYIKNYETSLQVVEGLARVNPEAFAPALTQLRTLKMMMASVMMDLDDDASDDDLDEVEQQVLQYVQSMQEFAEAKPDMYTIPLAESYQQYADLCFAKGQEHLAVTHYFQCIELLQSQLDTNTDKALPLVGKMAGKLICQIVQTMEYGAEELTNQTASQHINTAQQLLADTTRQIDQLSRGKDRIFQPKDRARAYAEIARAFDFECDQDWEIALDNVEAEELPENVLQPIVVQALTAKFQSQFQRQPEPFWQPTIDKTNPDHRARLLGYAMFYYTKSLQILEGAQQLEGDCLQELLDVCADILVLTYSNDRLYDCNYAMRYLELFCACQKQHKISAEKLLDGAKLAIVALMEDVE